MCEGTFGGYCIINIHKLLMLNKGAFYDGYKEQY